MLAIITGTIRPGREVSKLILQNDVDRLQQYKEALLFTIWSNAFTQIIFCENSNFGTECLADMHKEAVKAGIELELLSFEGNAKEVLKHGKGYGEGEIMDYVFKNSRLLSQETYFVKITGRIKIINIKDICERIKDQMCYFNIPNWTIRDYYDTKLYAMPVSIFDEYFRKAYTQVWDDEGIYLEKVYTKILLEEKIKVKNFERYPRVLGKQGSTGLDYRYIEWKCKIKDVISKFNGYKARQSRGGLLH